MKRISRIMEDFKYRLLVRGMLTKAEVTEGTSKRLSLKNDSRGVAIIEVIIILLVVMALGVIFKEKIKEIVQGIFDNIDKSNASIIS